MKPLLDAVRRYADAHADTAGVARTPLPGLLMVRAPAPSGLDHAVSKPLICLVLQGEKSMSMGAQSYVFGAGQSLLISADVPTVSQITRASAAAPYYSLVLELDLGVVAELAPQMPTLTDEDAAPLRVVSSEAEVADAVLRLLRLLERPEALAVLQTQLIREAHYWLLAGKHGAAIRRLGWPDGAAQRVARAVALLRAEYARPLRVDKLAAAAGMSPSSFHQHFRALTSLSPLQFQKHLRLIEARRLMMSQGAAANAAAFAVGYESVSQFTREYARMFGMPPGKHRQSVRDTSR